MKIRTGYVSNSSSSSFVVAGYVLEDKDKSRIWQLLKEFKPEIAKKYDNVDDYLMDIGSGFTDNDISIIYGNSDNGLPENKTFIGKFLGKDNGDYIRFENKAVDMEILRNELREFEKYLTVDEFSLKVIIGTMLD